MKNRTPKNSAQKKRRKTAKKTLARKFAILIDYENLVKSVSPTRLMDFSWLLDPIIKAGEIIFAAAFIPEFYGTAPPVKTLSNIHRFFPVFCPKKSGSMEKDKDIDSVDVRMDEFGRFLADHSDITDLVIVSGDGDFHGLAVFAGWRGKKVKIVSTHEAISGRFLLDKRLEKQLLF